MDIFQPPPLYPPLVTRPLNLEKNEQYDDLVEIKKKFRNLMKESFYHVESKASSEKNQFDATIQRYSDKYSKAKKIDLNKWKPDWNRLPRELKYFYEKEEKPTKPKRKSLQPNLVKRKIKKEFDIDKIAEIIAKGEIEENEENDEVEDKEKKVEKGSENEEEKEEELENGEEDEFEEEENDYIDTYFDNGENYGDEDMGGGDDEGPVY